MVKPMSCHRCIPHTYPLKITVSLLSLLIPAQVLGTAAAIVKTDELIVIAVDSLETDGQEHATGSRCKIFPIDDLFFVPNRIRAGPSGFDAVALAREAARDSKGIREIARRFIDVVQSLLIAALTSLRNTDRAVFWRILSDPLALGATFAGYENGELILNTATFTVVNGNATPLTLHVKQDPEESPWTSLVAPTEFRERFFRKYPRFAESLPAQDVIRAAKRFVQQAIDAHLPTVGPPLSTLVISPMGT